MSGVTRLERGLLLARMAVKKMYRMQGTGLPRIAEAIRRRVARWAGLHRGKATIWIDDFCGGLRFCCDLSEHMGSQIFFKGSYSGGQLKVLRDLLTPDSVFVDVGANHGEFTVCAADQVSKGHVFAFEPVPTIRERLERNVVANGFENVTIHPVGLSDTQQDDVPIYGEDSDYLDGTSHLGLPTLYGIPGRSSPLGNISLSRLDDLLSKEQRVDLLKIDVEGAEFCVLKGAEETIKREKPAIIFESSDLTASAAGYSMNELYFWLEKLGYQFEIIGDDGGLKPFETPVDFCNILATNKISKVKL